ncbi:MAG: erythromycin esterase family protein [Catenulispora sp.]|nr:erythromycin esterase family protein [Catenulispora sp.]
MAADMKDAVHPVDAGAVLGLLAGRRPRVLALGEPTHGEDVLLEVRNEVFRGLVEDEGYLTIGLESDCLMGLAVDDYVVAGRGELDEVMERGFSHGFGSAPGNRELVRWMREYNEGRPLAQRVRFAGFDGPLEMAGGASPRQALTALYAFVTERAGVESVPWSMQTVEALLGADDQWTEPAAMMDPARSVGRTPEAERLRLIADDLAAALDMLAPQLVQASSADEWERARLYARTARGLLRYHSWTADESPGRIAQLLGVRASMMAGNVLAAARRGPVLFHAHNAHLQRAKSRIRMGGMPMDWWSAGAIVETEMGADYAFFATALGTIRHQGVETPPSNTVEGLLYALSEERCVVDSRRLDQLRGEAAFVPRVSEWFGYAPLDPDHLGGYDGVVFVRDAPGK